VRAKRGILTRRRTRMAAFTLSGAIASPKVTKRRVKFQKDKAQ
jgi:hypothetical protein